MLWEMTLVDGISKANIAPGVGVDKYLLYHLPRSKRPIHSKPFTDISTMDSNPSNSTRPETVFHSTIANSTGNDGVFIVSPPDRRTEMAAPIHSSEPKPMTDPLKPLKPLPFRKRKRASEVPTSTLQPLNEDPWAAYVKGIEIFPRKGMLLAQNREDKMELVHIEQLKADPASIRSLVEIIKGLSYRSFPQLLRHYQHDDHTFLVWESVECSLSQVLGSRYALTETEIASIVWPVCLMSVLLILHALGRHKPIPRPMLKLCRSLLESGTSAIPIERLPHSPTMRSCLRDPVGSGSVSQQPIDWANW